MTGIRVERRVLANHRCKKAFDCGQPPRSTLETLCNPRVSEIGMTGMGCGSRVWTSRSRTTRNAVQPSGEGARLRRNARRFRYRAAACRSGRLAPVC